MSDPLRSRAMTNRSGVLSGTRVRASVAAGAPTVDLVTVPDIEILEVGEDWETSTGLFTWDEEDLASAIASQDDPSVRTPVLKLGHTDERDGFDGQPAFGRLINLRTENNDQTLVCDLAGVPKWLADVMPTAYPRRSIEGWFQCETRTGNTWPFVLTGLALLGAAYPAIKTLEDLPILWGAEMPPMEPADEEDEDTEVAAEMPAGLIRARKVVTVPTWLARRSEQHGEVVSAAAGKRGKSGGQVKASTSVSDVTSAYYDSLGPSQMWWWIRQVLVNPFQLVVDDDEGHLFLVDVNVDGNDNITFGEGQEVKVEYVAAVAANLAEVRKSGQVVAASHADRVAAGAPEKPAEEADDDDDDADDTGANGDGDDNQQEEQDIVLTDDALRALGLEPGATTEQINAAILAKAQGGDSGGAGDGGDSPAPGSEPSGTPGTGGDGDGDKSGDGDGDGNVTTEPGSGVTVPEGMVLVDGDQWALVQQEVAASAKDRQARAQQERDQFIAAACREGKFPRSAVAKYTTMWDNEVKASGNADTTRDLITKMAPGLVPVAERGSDGETDPQVAASTAYPEQWKRDPMVVRARNSVSTRLKVVND